MSLSEADGNNGGAPCKDSNASNEGWVKLDLNEGWVKLDLKLIDWSYMDFSRTFHSSATVHTVKEVIKNWHGGNIQSLTLCKDSYQETNELRDDKLTLKECGIGGAFDENKAPAVTLYYDFKPSGCAEPDPILMC